MGEEFAYVDDNKLLYTDTKFSMKAILGNFSRTLDRAHPAVQVDVEVDQVYLLSTISGYFTPCPNCGKDSWFSNFSASLHQAMEQECNQLVTRLNEILGVQIPLVETMKIPSLVVLVGFRQQCFLFLIRRLDQQQLIRHN